MDLGNCKICEKKIEGIVYALMEGEVEEAYYQDEPPEEYLNENWKERFCSRVCLAKWVMLEHFDPIAVAEREAEEEGRGDG